MSTDDTLDDLSRVVLVRSDLDPDRYRSAPLRRRVPACLRALKTASEAEAHRIVLAHPKAAATALDTLLIGVSSFFRDPLVFDVLGARVIPALASRQSPVCILSVGCSDGAEIYSVAMVLAEAGLLERARLLGMDCRPAALSRARAGVFDRRGLEGLEDGQRARHFDQVPVGWRVAAALRRRCEWVVGDATRRIPPGPWDVVLCRNLSIYLECSAAESLFRCIVQALTPGGFLVVGKAERPPAALALEAVSRCVYVKP